MGLLLFVCIVSVGLGFLAVMAIYGTIRLAHRIVPRVPRPKLFGRMPMIGGLLAALFFSYPVFHWIKSATTETVMGGSSEVADQAMDFLKLPPGTASDFCYRRSCDGTPFMADFQMKKEDFFSWMKLLDKNPLDIHQEYVAVYPIRNGEHGKALRIHRGWQSFYTMPNNPDNTESFIYDAETGRVYVMLTLR